MRIGIVGTENSHADHYIRHFNVEERFGPHRVTALSGGSTERNRDLAGKGAITELLGEPPELIGRVDAAIVCSRDGARHPDEAIPLLRSGIPVLVDKPLACDEAGARSILDAARESGVPVTSFSALRVAEQTRALADGLHGPPQVVTVAGPADRASEYGGLFFYGIHVVELALAFVPGQPVGELTVHDVDSAVVLTAQAGPTALVVELDKPQVREGTSWRVRIAGPGTSAAAEIRLGPEYVVPVAQVFVTMIESGNAPLSEAELLAPVRILSQANAAVHAHAAT